MTPSHPITHLTLLTQTDCGPCEQAKKVLTRVGADYQLQVTEVSLSSDEGRALATDAGVTFAPGILLDGALFSYGRLSETRLRRTLTAAASQRTHPSTSTN